MRTERRAIHSPWQATFAHVADLIGVAVTVPGPTSLSLAAPVPLPKSDSESQRQQGSPVASAVAIPPCPASRRGCRGR